MSLITRCPACTTLFKVVPDQLRVSEGWVRCGQCDEVFDANTHLQGERNNPSLPTANTSVVPSASSQPEQPLVEVDDSAPTISPGIFDDFTPVPTPQALGSSSDSVLHDRPGKSLVVEHPFDLEIHSDLPVPNASMQASSPIDIEGLLSAPHTSDASVLDPSLAHATDTKITEAQTNTVRPSFLRDAQSPSAWTRPWVKLLLSVLSLGLMLVLALQVVLHERDRLAASVADFRPALLTMCDALNCKISPYRQIDSVVIENSAFVKIRGDIYRLNITLKNTALIDIAAPAVELTLTDLQEQPMVRQVLSASDLGVTNGSLAAGGDLTVTVPVHVKTASPSDRISGYRLLAFYP